MGSFTPGVLTNFLPRLPNLGSELEQGRWQTGWEQSGEPLLPGEHTLVRHPLGWSFQEQRPSLVLSFPTQLSPYHFPLQCGINQHQD
jgi:hypothetical protein